MAQALVARALAIPYLDDDSPDGCPIDVHDLLRYLRANTGSKALGRADVTFVRTARVNECDYWTWRFADNGGEAFALVMRDPAGDSWMSCYRNDARLTPEEILLADYRAALEED